MQVKFSKYHGTGNDFIMLNNFDKNYLNFMNKSTIKKLCARHFGIGADGLIIMNRDDEYDFSMRYFNSDGKEGTMCGNGGRCIVAFARDEGIISTTTKFNAIDGVHSAMIEGDGIISLKMSDVNRLSKSNNHYVLNTGSPHYVEFVSNLSEINIVEKGRLIRYSDKYKPEGLNVNFVERLENKLLIKTYERGVENETFSCGTGSVAAAIASIFEDIDEKYSILIQTKGGLLSVDLIKSGNTFNNIYLRGPAECVFKGIYII